ncbi:hypothetical protein MPSEU_000167900 [Mayamaea pseudoterrestris]|nr:hypothetical protein MPSEU_000167900 [Mayamaea pseudoterrestris]
MNFILSTIGLPQPCSRSARAAVMNEPGHRRRLDADTLTPFIGHRDSLLCLSMPLAFTFNKCDDDDTASTSSACTESSSNSCLAGSVSFADPIVTDVFVRPTTTWDEKNDLYYNDNEFRSFRRDYHLKRQGKSRETVVCFKEVLVTNVHTYACTAEKDDMFYSESDLKRFLDDFVASLHGNNLCES